MLCTRCRQCALNVSNVDHLVYIWFHYPARMCEGVFACLSVCQFVSPVKKVFVGLKQFSKLTVALTL